MGEGCQGSVLSKEGAPAAMAGEDSELEAEMGRKALLRMGGGSGRGYLPPPSLLSASPGSCTGTDPGAMEVLPCSFSCHSAAGQVAVSLPGNCPKARNWKGAPTPVLGWIPVVQRTKRALKTQQSAPAPPRKLCQRRS